MLLGRGNETKYLENSYSKDGSQLIVMYGREGVGKTSLIMDFCKGREYEYYLARACSEGQQLAMMAGELGCDPDYDSIFSRITVGHCRKKILVIDEFQFMVKASDDFMKQIIRLIHDNFNNQQVMVILCSSSFSWVENDMVTQIGAAAYEISGFLKVKELSFLDLVRRFQRFSFSDAMGVYAVLGGVPGLWRYFSSGLSLKENICRTILKRGTVMNRQVDTEISEKLREPAVYHTILARMAAGEDKLNELYNSTGYSRAKISVYLKNLMELEIVEKIYSVETDGHDNARKGIYRIKNHLILFWFRFVFPHLSMLEILSEEEFYDRYISEGIRSFEAPFFKEVCREYMELMAQSSSLPVSIEGFGSWCGKVGDIDVLGIAEDGTVIAGMCGWEKDLITFEDYEWLQFCVRMAKLKADYFYFFTGGDFDDKLKAEAAQNKNITLVDPSQL